MEDCETNRSPLERNDFCVNSFEKFIDRKWLYMIIFLALRKNKKQK